VLLPNPERRFPLVCDPQRSGSALLGLRVPVLSGPLAALAGLRVPAAQSSANFSGAREPRRLQDVPVEQREGADLSLDGGELPGTASTVIDFSEFERSGRWRIVREGPLDLTAITTTLSGSC
jgi:L-threonylcarbamoyladenylate synthase